MPRPEHLPTPASSTEIRSKDGAETSHQMMSFELPPPAAGAEHRGSSSGSVQSVQSSSASSYHPASPVSPAIPSSEVVKIRRRSSIAQAPAAKDAFALPPPPTRSRKIIQMKPRGQAEEAVEMMDDGGAKAGKSTPSPPKKKQPSATSVAGRKIARKTAHSLIERRRRSKMNEEFGVLKDMIPACTGEMHKLAILQASIDYVRYLEDCVSKLKAENTRNNITPSTEQFMLPPSARRGSYTTSRQYQSYEEDEDVEMGNSPSHSPTNTTPTAISHGHSHSPTGLPHGHSHQPSLSPAMLPQDSSKHRQSSYSSSISTDPRRYSFASSTTSPYMGPNAYNYTPSTSGSTLTSPALGPMRDRDLDQEATAALLMLNTDRRGTTSHSSIGGRGMSVKDLLSS